MLKTVTKISAISLLFTFVSCYDCDTWGKAYKNNECLLVVERIPKKYENYFNYRGKHPITKNRVVAKVKLATDGGIYTPKK